MTDPTAPTAADDLIALLLKDVEPNGWRDVDGDLWTLGDDGLLHTPETRPFPREHVEKKWGPLVPVFVYEQALDPSPAPPAPPAVIAPADERDRHGQTSAGEAYYREHGWSGCDGSSWERLPTATRDGWEHAARLADRLAVAEQEAGRLRTGLAAANDRANDWMAAAAAREDALRSAEQEAAALRAQVAAAENDLIESRARCAALSDYAGHHKARADAAERQVVAPAPEPSDPAGLSEHLFLSDLRRHPTGEVRLHVAGRLVSGTVAGQVVRDIDDRLAVAEQARAEEREDLLRAGKEWMGDALRAEARAEAAEQALNEARAEVEHVSAARAKPLLAALAEARAECEKWRGRAEGNRGGHLYDAVVADRDALRAQVATLAETLDRWLTASSATRNNGLMLPGDRVTWRVREIRDAEIREARAALGDSAPVVQRIKDEATEEGDRG